jgi:hypothetical protein
MDHDFTRFPEVVPAHYAQESPLPEPVPISSFHAELPATQEHALKEPQPATTVVGQSDGQQRRSWILSKKVWVIATIALVVAVIITATTLGVLLSRKSRSKKENDPQGSDLPSISGYSR